ARQWLNPRGFAIFLGAQRGLKDQRYKLIHYSKEELSIRLSNVTVHDEGVYRCFYYGTPFKTENKTVKVLSAPSKPVVQVSQDAEKRLTLSCCTRGSKPQPRISWLLDNGIELPGDTRHTAEGDGKRWSTCSTLTVLAHGPSSTATCVARHRALGEEQLTATFRFGSLPPPGTDGRPPGAPAAPCSPSNMVKTLSVSASFTEQDLKNEGIKKEKNLLLPVLVAALIFVLLIIVSLFMRKLKKAHGLWKRENDASEQTLESYKSRSNEDNPGPEKNKQ
ncbi:CRTAM protein, partial [Nothoprocta pentlandii]|nr:CRTAM protein [Nothoprocta pentlandii]